MTWAFGRISGISALAPLLLALSLSACSASMEEASAPQLGETLGSAGAASTPLFPPSAPFQLVVSDSFSAAGWWFATSHVGNGYVSSRPEAQSATRVGDEYGRNPVGDSEGLGKAFTLDHTPTDCIASAYLDALSPVDTVTIDTFDTATRKVVRSANFAPGFFTGAPVWQRFDNARVKPEQAFTSSTVSVRLTLNGNGEWQEALFDDVTLYCD